MGNKKYNLRNSAFFISLSLKKKIMNFVDWGRVIGYFHSDSNFFKHISKVKFSLISGVFCKRKCNRFFFCSPGPQRVSY